MDCLVLEASSPPFLELLLLVFLLPAELLPLLGPVIRALLFVDWLTVLWDVAVLDFLSDENEDWVNSSSSSDPSNASSSRSSSSSALNLELKFRSSSSSSLSHDTSVGRLKDMVVIAAAFFFIPHPIKIY